MYLGKVNSPLTRLREDIDSSQTTIPVEDESVFPDAPNLATIGGGPGAETILYKEKASGELRDVTRGFQGEAKAWSFRARTGRTITAYDIDTLKENVKTTYNELDGTVQLVASRKVVTVGPGSGNDFNTINEAIEYLTQYKMRYNKEDIRAVIRLAEDFYMEEQVLVNGEHLNWITIESMAGDAQDIEDITQGEQIDGYERPEITSITVDDYDVEYYIQEHNAKHLNEEYIAIETADNNIHYFWFNVNEEGSDPEPGYEDATAHEVEIGEDDEPDTVAQKLKDVVDEVKGVTATVDNRTITVENDDTGEVTLDEMDEPKYWKSTSGTSMTTVDMGDEETAHKAEFEVDDYEVKEDETVWTDTSKVLNGDYIQLQTGTEDKHYFWFNSEEEGEDPDLDGTGHEISLDKDDEAPTTAQKLKDAIDNVTGFTATVDDRTITVENDDEGAVQSVNVESDNIYASVVQAGRDEGYKVKIHATGHGFEEGDRITIRNHEGLVEEHDYNGVWYVSNPETDTFELSYSDNPDAVYDSYRAGDETTKNGEVVDPVPVKVSRQALDTTWEFFYRPAFGVARGTLPTIACEFEMDESGDSEYMSYKDGLCATDGGHINIMPFCGFSKADGSNIYGTRSSIINANDAIANEAGRHGVWAYSNTIINARRVMASNCGWAGTEEDEGNGFDSVGRPVGSGIVSTRNSLINAEGCNVSESQGDNILGQYGGIVSLGGHDLEYTSENPINGKKLNVVAGAIFDGEGFITEIKAYTEVLNEETWDSTTEEIDLNKGNIHEITLSGTDIDTLTFANARSGVHSFTLIIHQDTTARTISFPDSVVWNQHEIPDLSVADETYVLSFFTTDGGTKWYGFLSGETFGDGS